MKEQSKQKSEKLTHQEIKQNMLSDIQSDDTDVVRIVGGTGTGKNALVKELEEEAGIDEVIDNLPEDASGIPATEQEGGEAATVYLVDEDRLHRQNEQLAEAIANVKSGERGMDDDMVVLTSTNSDKLDGVKEYQLDTAL